jgi:tripartite-type tricarboxylate transporter receptor subunit TctC
VELEDWREVRAPADEGRRAARVVLAQAEVRAPLEPDGTFVSGGTPEQFGAFIAAEVEKWSQVARATGMKPD